MASVKPGTRHPPADPQLPRRDARLRLPESKPSITRALSTISLMARRARSDNPAARSATARRSSSCKRPPIPATRPRVSNRFERRGLAWRSNLRHAPRMHPSSCGIRQKSDLVALLRAKLGVVSMVESVRLRWALVPTIGDVARRAGVSRSTVSYALSGKRSISRETRERVEAAIAELALPRTLGQGRSPHRRRWSSGFSSSSSRTSSRLRCCSTSCRSPTRRGRPATTSMVTEADRPHAVDRILSSGMVDGVILLNVAYEDPRLPVMRKMRQPGAMVGLPRVPDGFDVFDLDFARPARCWSPPGRAGTPRTRACCPAWHVYERGVPTCGGSEMPPCTKRPEAGCGSSCTTARRSSRP